MKKTLVWMLFLFVCISVSAQKIAVKTNLLYDVTTTLNLGQSFVWLRNGQLICRVITILLI